MSGGWILKNIGVNIEVESILEQEEIPLLQSLLDYSNKYNEEIKV